MKKLKNLETKDLTEGTLPVHWDFITLYSNDNWMGRTFKNWMISLVQYPLFSYPPLSSLTLTIALNPSAVG